MRDQLCNIEVEVEQSLRRCVKTKWLYDELSDSVYNSAYDAYKYEEVTALQLMQAMAEELKKLRHYVDNICEKASINRMIDEAYEWTEANFEVTDVDVEWPSC